MGGQVGCNFAVFECERVNQRLKGIKV
jgi:hypothetical protein